MDLPPLNSIEEFLANPCYAYLLKSIYEQQEELFSQLRTVRGEEIIFAQGRLAGLDHVKITVEGLYGLRAAREAASQRR